MLKIEQANENREPTQEDIIRQRVRLIRFTLLNMMTAEHGRIIGRDSDKWEERAAKTQIELEETLVDFAKDVAKLAKET